jgi:hypothetical protein
VPRRVIWTLVGLSTSVACFSEPELDAPPSASSESTSTTEPPGGLTVTASTTSPSSESSEAGTGGCMLDSECRDDDACSLDVCSDGACEHLPLDGVPTSEQTIGDCRRVVCVAGAATEQAYPDDLPDDHEACTVDGCNGADVEHMPAPIGTACSDGTCDGMGSCVQCLSPDDCDGLPVDDDCATRTCDAGVCGQVFAHAGTPVNGTQQTTGDCHRIVCDGEGGTVAQPANNDPFVDGLECTVDECDDGVPHNDPLPAGTPCAAGECNAYGQCTGCNEAEDCGDPTSCQAPTCNGSGVCGVANVADGTPLPAAMQDDGDCQELRCDGAGASASYEDNDDVPPDDGNACTDEVCSGGLPQHPDEPVGTPCGNGDSCDGMGACAECIDAGDCPPAGQCGVVDCVDNACVVDDAMVGTPCNDGSFCTATDTCAANGTCVGSGSPCDGPDDDADCRESCDEVTNACTAVDPDDSPCDDGLACTTDDVCTAGECNGAPLMCAAPQSCFEACSGCADADC